MNPADVARQRETPVKARGPGRPRSWIVWSLFFSTVINYISRQTFSVLAPLITAQYHFTHTDLAKILGAFQISYAVTWLLGGIFLDAVGTRLGLALAVVFWSVVNILTGFASSVFSFAAFRFLLGIGEGFNWPGASKTVPTENRAQYTDPASASRTASTRVSRFARLSVCKQCAGKVEGNSVGTRSGRSPPVLPLADRIRSQGVRIESRFCTRNAVQRRSCTAFRRQWRKSVTVDSVGYQRPGT
ncbi:MAG: MFS transporter [Terracidiphilus sp.]